MAISDAAIDAAVRKATEAGLLARRKTPEEMAIDREIMRGILNAASEAAEEEEFVEPWQMRRRAGDQHIEPGSLVNSISSAVEARSRMRLQSG